MSATFPPQHDQFHRIAIAIGYLIKIDSVCLIDQFTGKCAALIADSLLKEREFAASLGLPLPNSVDDPSCIDTS